MILLNVLKLQCLTKPRLLKIYRQTISRKCSQNSIKIGNLTLDKYLNAIQTEFAEAKNHQILQPIVNLIEKRSSILKNLCNLNELLNDKDNEIKQLAKEEQQTYMKHLEELNEQIKHSVLPVDEEDAASSLVLEVSSGVGGQEAMLFAKEMFEMYQNFASYKNWQCEIAEYSVGSDGSGLRHAVLLITGPEVYKYLKHEAGVHRVQRVPTTEKGGRIHTSTVSVVAVPQPDEIQVHLDPKDLRIETKRASGAGGQHVNTTDSAVRILHIPSGISVECQTNRSQHKNRQNALARLRAKLYEMQLEDRQNRIQATKKSQVKSNYRNEKIRTYNFNQDRITDHRLQGHNVHNLKGFLLGSEPLEQLILKIDTTRRLEILKNILKDFQ